MMGFVTTLFVAAWLGAGPGAGPSCLAAAAAAPAVEKYAADAPAAIPPPAVLRIAFEVRDVTVASPDWRGKLLARLEPVARREGATAWTVDRRGLVELLEYCQGDARCKVVKAPRMVADVGAPARMTNETSHQYVAHLRRVSDGPPNQGAQLAFIPEIDEVHDGVRVHVLSSRLDGSTLLARVTVEQNQLISFITTRYTESIQSASGEKRDDGVVKTSLIDRLRPDHGAGPAAINGTFNVPEMASSRIEGEWSIPSEGALLVSMGPTSRRDKGLRGAYQERLIAITARPTTDPATATAPTTTESKAPATP
jgi:hypothetical protein